MSWITPISLLTYITDTTLVSGRSAASNRARSSSPSGRDVEVRDLEAFALELAHRVERRLVLGLDRDEVLALVLVEMRGALEREVDRLGRARRPHEFLRVAVDERRDFRARFLDRRLGLPAERVRARRRVAEVLRQVRNHLLRDARIDRRGRRVVEVDGKLMGVLEIGRCFRRWSSIVRLAGDRRPSAVARSAPVVLQHRNFAAARALLANELGQRDRAQVT